MSKIMSAWTATPAQIQMFANRTALLPVVVLDKIVGEIVSALRDDPPRAEHVYETLRADDVVDYVSSRSALCFENNMQFRKKMLAADPRPEYYAFVRHWLTGVLQERFPDVLRRLPTGFAVGEPVPA